ncbi:MAG: hypothetical protein R2706_08235 [Acidimicrobiales bacterium]
MTSIDKFEGRSSLKTWIYRIMINKVRTLAGREAKIIPFAAMGNAAPSEGGVNGADHLGVLNCSMKRDSPAPRAVASATTRGA